MGLRDGPIGDHPHYPHVRQMAALAQGEIESEQPHRIITASMEMRDRMQEGEAENECF